MTYTKEFLLDAFFWRYTDILLQMPESRLDKFVEMIYNYCSSVDKDTFRKYASLDAQEIQKFRLATGC